MDAAVQVQSYFDIFRDFSKGPKELRHMDLESLLATIKEREEVPIVKRHADFSSEMTDFQRLVSQNSQLTVLLELYRRGKATTADLKLAAANIAGDLPFYRGIEGDEPGFQSTARNLERNYSLLQKEIIFASMRKTALYFGAFGVLFACVGLWNATTTS